MILGPLKFLRKHLHVTPDGCNTQSLYILCPVGSVSLLILCSRLFDEEGEEICGAEALDFRVLLVEEVEDDAVLSMRGAGVGFGGIIAFLGAFFSGSEEDQKHTMIYALRKKRVMKWKIVFASSSLCLLYQFHTKAYRHFHYITTLRNKITITHFFVLSCLISLFCFVYIVVCVCSFVS